MDYAVFDIYGDNIIYKSNFGNELRTFMSCQFNYFLEFEDDYHALGNRHCYQCNGTTPVYAETAGYCKSCASFEGYVTYENPDVQYSFVNACRNTPSCEASDICQVPDIIVDPTVTGPTDEELEDEFAIDFDEELPGTYRCKYTYSG